MSENGRPCQGPLSPHRPQGKRRASTCTTKNGYARRAEDEVSLSHAHAPLAACVCVAHGPRQARCSRIGDLGAKWKVSEKDRPVLGAPCIKGASEVLGILMCVYDIRQGEAAWSGPGKSEASLCAAAQRGEGCRKRS
jgi:hypothetical protein